MSRLKRYRTVNVAVSSRATVVDTRLNSGVSEDLRST